MSISGFGKNIACEAYSTTEADTQSFGTGDKTFKVHRGVIKSGLIPMKVVYGLANEGIYAGDIVYVRQEGVVSTWTKEVEVEGQNKKVVVVETSQVVLIDRLNRQAWIPSLTPVPAKV